MKSISRQTSRKCVRTKFQKVKSPIIRISVGWTYTPKCEDWCGIRTRKQILKLHRPRTGTRTQIPQNVSYPNSHPNLISLSFAAPALASVPMIQIFQHYAPEPTRAPVPVTKIWKLFSIPQPHPHFRYVILMNDSSNELLPLYFHLFWKNLPSTKLS